MIQTVTKQFQESGEVITAQYPDAELVKPILSELILKYDEAEQQYHKEPQQLTFVNSVENSGPKPDSFRRLFEEHEDFKKITDFALQTIKETVPLFPNIDKANNNPYILDAWGVLYKPDTSTETWTSGLEPHSHWPATWSFVYYVDACNKCAPIVFPTCINANMHSPVTGLLIIFPGWVAHGVPPQKCDHNRISIAGNIVIKHRLE